MTDPEDTSRPGKPSDAIGQADVPTSKRRGEWNRMDAGQIAERAIAELRPNAPYAMIQRLVAARCTAAGLPVPSRPAMVARISQVRRFGTRHFADRKIQITVDHALIVGEQDGAKSVAVLSAALLDPPGIIVAWKVSVGRSLIAIEAGLLAALHRSGAPNNARIQLPTRPDPGDRLMAALSAASVVTIRSLDREAGGEATRILGSKVGGYRLRRRAHRSGAAVIAAADGTIERLRDEVATAVADVRRRRGRRIPVFGFVSPYHEDRLMDALRAVADDDADCKARSGSRRC